MPPDLPHPGELLAGYRIERQLGHGATGVVFLARQVALDRPIALKVVGAPFADDEAFRERFRHEARAAAALDHPNVVTVLDSGEDDDRLWLAMRLVDGPDLRVLLRRTGRLEPTHAVSIVEQIAAALDAAHAAGLVHRDVKPGNVLVEDAPGGALHAELADFGLVGGAGGPAPDADGESVVEGTPDYAAPEQLAGQDATAAADVYGLGRVFAEMLTGDPATPVVPGATGFAAVVARATDPDPVWRYPTAGALAIAARAVLEPGGSAAAGAAGPAAAGLGSAGAAAAGVAGAGAMSAAAAASGAARAIDESESAVAGSLPSPDEVQADIEYEEVAALTPVPSASGPTRGRGPATTLGAAPRRRRRRWWWRVVPLVVLLGVVAAAALFFGELRDGMLRLDAAGDRSRPSTTAGGAGASVGSSSGTGAGAGSASGAITGSGSRGAGSGSSGTGTQGSTPGGTGASASERGSGGAGSASSETVGSTGAGDPAASSGTGSSGALSDAAAAGSASASSAGSPDSVAAGSTSPPGTAGSRAVDAASSAPPLGGAGPGTAPTAAAFPPARGMQRFGGGNWVLDLPASAGWIQNAVQELSGGRMLLTRLRRDDGTRLVVEHRPGQTAVFGPWPGESFAVRVPGVGRTAALLFRGGRYEMCREAVCAAVPVNGPSGGVLLIVSTATDVQARRELRRAASGLRVS